jgi:stage II sporulation protein D
MRKNEVKAKIILIVISIIIIVFIIVNNFIGGSGRIDNTRSQDEIEGERIEKAEAMRYFSFLFFNREEMNGLPYTIPENLLPQGQTKSEYANALYSAGVFGEDVNPSILELDKNLTCGEYRDLLWAIVDLLDLNYKDLSAFLPQRLTHVQVEEELLKEEFLVMYQAMMDQMNALQEEQRFVTKKLYLLALDNTQKDIKDNVSNSLQKWITQEQNAFYVDNRYLTVSVDEYVEAVTCSDEIIMVKGYLPEMAQLNNVYLIKGKDKKVTAYLSSYQREFTTSLSLSQPFENVVGDLSIQNGVITGITLKPDMIRGKVLVTGQEEIEVEGYGVLPLHEDYRIYKVYGDISMEKTNSILVGYTVTDFVVSDGKICAALIQDKIKAENIRVLINTTEYHSIYHEIAIFTADSDFIVDDGVSQVAFSAGEEVTVEKGCKLLERGRIKIVSSAEEGKITLLSLNRNYGIPKYRGSIEIAVTKEGLVVVNELSIEEYLYSVVPSEMPTNYGNEALKVQAVCARSYAYKQLMANRYSSYGAHVDDSVNCQVYNNVEENEASILAVKETYGQVIMSNGSVLTAYYFSTSCGHTASVADVWEDSKEAEYLTGTLQVEENVTADFSDEATFRKFIIADSVDVMQNSSKVTEVINTYDSGFLMYRWKVNLKVDDLSNQINEFLAKRYNKKSTSILTYMGKVTDEEIEAMELKNQRIVNDMVFANKPIASIGTVRDIKVVKRGDSGIIKEMIIVGTKKTILVRYQTNIRTILAPSEAEIIRLDGSKVSGMTLLPSAFCVIDVVSGDGKTTVIKITGGGFGHGVGMSQNGVKAMTKLNKTYDEILKHYYTNSTLSMMYE